MNQIRASVILILVMLVASGCAADDSGPPKITITLDEYGMRSFDRPYVLVTLKHEKGDSIYNAHCDLTAKLGNRIVDTAFVYFANGNTINAGDIVSEEGVFFELDSHDDYDTITKECDRIRRD